MSPYYSGGRTECVLTLWVWMVKNNNTTNVYILKTAHALLQRLSDCVCLQCFPNLDVSPFSVRASFNSHYQSEKCSVARPTCSDASESGISQKRLTLVPSDSFTQHISDVSILLKALLLLCSVFTENNTFDLCFILCIWCIGCFKSKKSVFFQFLPNQHPTAWQPH